MKKKALLLALIGAICCPPVATAEVTMNGFASFAVGVSDEDGAIIGYNKKVATLPDSLAAIQFRYEVNDKVSATVQLMARGEDNWEPAFEWAYVTYETDGGAQFRAGKLRVPFYMYSDYLDVRYAQPFLRPNAELYDIIPDDIYTGIDAVLPIEAGSTLFTIQPFAGTADSKNDYSDYYYKDTIGANITWEWDALILRTIYARTTMQAESLNTSDDFANFMTSTLSNKTGQFYGVGFRYEPGNFFTLGEYASRDVEGIFADLESYYLAVGYHVGEFSPYLMYGKTRSKDDDERELTPEVIATDPYYEYYPVIGALLNYERSSFSVGVRWDIMPSVALKADITHYKDIPTVGEPLPAAVQNSVDSANVFTLSVDTVF